MFPSQLYQVIPLRPRSILCGPRRGSTCYRYGLASPYCSASTPTHAVRKVIRNLHADGTEEVIVSFTIAEKEIRRVRLLPNTGAPLAGTMVASCSCRPEHGTTNMRRRALSMEDEDDQVVYNAPHQKKKDVPLTIQYGKMKNALTMDREIKQVYDDGGSAYRKKQSSSRSAGFPVYRMPLWLLRVYSSR